MRIRRRFRFEAAHRLPEHPGKCRELHGHSFRLTVEVERAVDSRTGMGLDFGELKTIVRRQVLERLDHRDLNAILDNPTAERVAQWIWNHLVESLPGLVEIELHETDACSVVYRGE